MSNEIGADFGVILAVFLALVLFGIGYNALVAWLERKGYTEGYLSLIVAFGVTVTLAGVAILSIHAALLTLGAFVASGTPMIIGSIVRYLRKREEMKRSIVEEIEKMTKPREWPNCAKEARDRSAEEAIRALRAIEPLLEKEAAETEKIRRLAIAVNSLQTILRLLEREGAQTRP